MNNLNKIEEEIRNKLLNFKNKKLTKSTIKLITNKTLLIINDIKDDAINLNHDISKIDDDSFIINTVKL